MMFGSHTSKGVRPVTQEFQRSILTGRLMTRTTSVASSALDSGLLACIEEVSANGAHGSLFRGSSTRRGGEAQVH